jgi:glycosyltransferase involved in cell wall biosynthesis
MIKEFLRQGWRVDLVLLKRDGALLTRIPSNCRIMDLSTPRLRAALPKLSIYLRRERPDFVLASIWPVTSIAALASIWARYTGVMVLSEHSTLSLSLVGRGINGIALRAAMRWLNPRRGVIVAVSEGVRADLLTMGAPSDRVFTIHNPIEVDTSVPKKEDALPLVWRERPRPMRFLAVGRLKDAKDYPMMLDAFAHVLNRGIDAGLAIAGDGVDRAKIERLLASNPSFDGRVQLLGDVADPGALFAQAGLFLFTSKFEGFGNVLVEAMASGLPVVSTDCRSGPREILQDGLLGELVPVGDSKSFADAIERSLAAPRDADALRARAQDFKPRDVVARYIELYWQQTREMAAGVRKGGR